MKIPAGVSRILTADLNLTELLEVEGVLILDPKSNITITTNKNIVVTGDLISQPEGTVVHRILFTGIDESKFVGGGEAVLDSDTGLWVMGAGRLSLLGSEQPTFEKGIVNADTFQVLAAASTRNMRIEGTATGQAHVFIKSSRPQTIKYVQLRFLGPRKDANKDGVKELVAGRYACHFHHSEDGSRGTVIEGCIARDCNNHCFVPHGSHGIAMRNNIVYNVTETPFWYDFGHKTNDLLWENNLVVNVKYVPRSQDQDNDGAPTFGAGGFVLGFGDSNICRGNVVIGTSGTTLESAGYIWPELRNDADISLPIESSWTFEDNTVINCPLGLGVWQNNLLHHIVKNTTIINCPIAIEHGAYQNNYRYLGGKITGGYISVKAASSNTNRVRFEEMEIDAAGGNQCVVINEGPLDGVVPILFRKCKFSNYKVAAILDQNPGPGLKSVDVIDCGLNVLSYKVSSTARDNEIIRVQEGKNAWKVTRGGNVTIPPFAPSQWGTGTGLKAEYFTPDFKTLLLSRIEPNVNLFDLTHPSPHYLVPTTFAARWSGKIQPQYNENHTFYCQTGGGVRLWIDNKLIIDKWQERYPGEVKSTVINLIANVLYDFKLEFYNSDDRSGCTLEWASPSRNPEFIPMSQLYPGDVKPSDPPTNQPPKANAGEDQTIEVTTMLYGTGVDPEGGKLTYKWEQTSGQTAIIVTPETLTTVVKGLVTGENIFKLTVTDDKGASASDEVKVVVK